MMPQWHAARCCQLSWSSTLWGASTFSGFGSHNPNGIYVTCSRIEEWGLVMDGWWPRQCSLSGAVRGGTMAPAPHVLIINRWKEWMGARSHAWAHRSAPRQPGRVSGPQLSSIPLNLRQSQSPQTSKIHCCLREHWSCVQSVKQW